MSKSSDKIQKLLDRENAEAKRLMDLSGEKGKDRIFILKERSRVQERIMVLEEAVKILKAEDTSHDDAMTALLDRHCSETGEAIKVGQVVKLFDWGTSAKLIGYGKFVWDEQYKKFDIEFVDDLNAEMGIRDISGIDNDDMYKVGVEKLSKAEKKKLAPYL